MAIMAMTEAMTDALRKSEEFEFNLCSHWLMSLDSTKFTALCKLVDCSTIR